MKVLISVTSLEEARIAVAGGGDILDIKNPDEGSLGAQFPWVLREITQVFKSQGILCSATLGDLHFQPGTAALAAAGAAQTGVQYIKAGLYGVKNREQAIQLMSGIVQAVKMTDEQITVAAAGYADYHRFGGISYLELVEVAEQAGADVVMVDTAIKDGNNLFDLMSVEEIAEFIKLGQNKGLSVALAGSLTQSHLEKLHYLKPDIIGLRGAFCKNNNRKSNLDQKKVLEFMHALHRIQSTVALRK